MKKFYLFTLFIFCSLAGKTQTFKYSNAQHVVATIDQQSAPLYINFTTSDPQDITFMFERISNSLPEEWNLTLCDYDNCYVGVPETGTMKPISRQEAGSGLEGFFNLTANTNNISGEGIVEIYVYDSNDYEQGDTVSWTLSYEAVPTSIVQSEQNEILTIYPNPATDFITIKGIEISDINVFNNHGLMVRTYKEIGDLNLDISKFTPGIYVFSCRDDKGNIYNKRLMIN